MSFKDRFQGKDYLTLMDWRKEEIKYILDISADLKRMRMMKQPHEHL